MARGDGCAALRPPAGDEAGCNSISAGLTGVSPDPTYMFGSEQRQRGESSHALHRGFAVVPIMIIALRTIQARYLIRFGELLGCGIVFVATTVMVAVPVGSGIRLSPIASCGSSGVRSESRTRIQGGPGR